MHECFRLDETVPVAPGTSPFRVRGVYYARVVEHAHSMPFGFGQFLDELADPRVREFIQQPFQFMSWYDALPALPCGIAGARIRAVPFEDFMRERARVAMVKLVPSMFRVFSRLVGPKFAAPHAPRLFRMYFDFVELRLFSVGDEAGSGSISGIPLYVAPAIVNLSLGIITGALESLGAKSIDASYSDVAVSDSRRGFDLVTCRADVAWRLDRTAVNMRP